MVMDARTSEVAGFLLLIEHEMRTQGLWSDKVPTEHDLSSLEPFSVDRLDFEQWVQWIFLPKMKTIVERGQPLPSVSGIWHMAEHVQLVHRERKTIHSDDSQLRLIAPVVEIRPES